MKLSILPETIWEGEREGGREGGMGLDEMKGEDKK